MCIQYKIFFNYKIKNGSPIFDDHIRQVIIIDNKKTIGGRRLNNRFLSMPANDRGALTLLRDVCPIPDDVPHPERQNILQFIKPEEILLLFNYNN